MLFVKTFQFIVDADVLPLKKPRNGALLKTDSTTLTGLLTGQIIPNTPLPTCYSANKNVSVTLNNVTISGCQCCSVVITQSTGREITSL